MTVLTEIESDLERALRVLEPLTPYAEVMAESTGGLRLRLDRESRAATPSPALEGAAFRAWSNDMWLETVASGLTSRTLAGAAEALADRLRSAPRGGRPPGEPATGSGERSTVEQRREEDFSLDERIAWAKERFDWATAVPGVTNAFVLVQSIQDDRLFRSTAGARAYQRFHRMVGQVLCLAIENGKVETDYVGEGRTGGVEVLDLIDRPRVEQAARDAVALLSATSPPAGRMHVILDPSTTGTFAHESFGHGTEADQILRDRSYLKPLLGTMVGPEELTIVDNGAYDGGWGQIYFDDEGTPAQRTVLVDRGRFVEVLHDRETAAALGRQPTGNARRADFLSRSFVRMTNTYVEPGDWSLDELVREAKDGVLLEHFKNGIEDPLGGNMQLKVAKGRRIVDGELRDILPSMALSGRVLEFLPAIRGISKPADFWISPGFCGKGHTDLIVNGSGGPYLLSEAVVGPA